MAKGKQEKTPEEKAAAAQARKDAAAQKKRAELAQLQDSGATLDEINTAAERIMPGRYLNETEMKKAEDATAAAIASEATVKMVIEDDKSGPLTIIVNGKSYEYKRGRVVEVPKSHKFILMSVAKCRQENERLEKAMKNKNQGVME